MKRITKFLMVNLLMMVCLVNHLNATQNCATELTQEQVDYMNETREERKNMNDRYFEQGAISIPLTAHIIRDSFGNGGLNEDNLLKSVEQLNLAFKQTGFEFSLCSTNYINNNDYYENLIESTRDDSDEFKMAVPNLIAGSINVFYAPKSTNWSSYPSSKIKYGKDWIVINNAYATDGSTLAHEMGHYFSLYHTHEYFLGFELADGSNCKTAGDELCDTPAEPFINSKGEEGIQGCVNGTTCKYICDDTDKNNDEYIPNINNIMSYAPASCKDSFSPEQTNRMQESYIKDRHYLSDDCEQISANSCQATDKEALIALYNATDGPNWTNKWDLTTDHKDWYGIRVNDEGCVKELFLGTNNLVGTIPAVIGNLTNLQRLMLNHNQLEGEIPTDIGLLINLTYLGFDQNNLSGIIPPEIGMLKSLVSLVLSNNKFTGIIPEEIGDLSQLSSLNLGNNQLNGKLPKSLSYLTNLAGLNVNNNDLSGCYESELKSLCDKFWQPTDDIISAGNNFDASWEDFCLYDKGTCEINPCEATDKEVLIALYNATDGPNWKNKWDLNTDHKQWYGVSVDEEGCVIHLSLIANFLKGSLPNEIQNLSHLEWLELRGNSLTGSIPSEIAELNNLINIDLSYNNLSGIIPPEIGMLGNIKILNLFDNELTGIIPLEIGNLSQLTSLNLSENQLTGQFPITLSNLTSLKGLSIRYNNLSGCYESELKNLCDKFWQPTDDIISAGNNFDASWEDFCLYDKGTCEINNNNFVAGDYNKNGIVNHYDALYLGVSYGKTGMACAATDINDCLDWDDNINGINAKYIDGDRNGIINEADAQAIKDNYGAVSNMNEALNTQPNNFNFKLELVEHIWKNSINKYTFQIYIEDFDGEISDIQGIAGCINFGDLSVNFPWIKFLDSNFETSIIIDNYNIESNTLDFALSSLGDINLKPNRPIAELAIVVVENNNGGGDYAIELTDIITINATGELSEGINSIYNLPKPLSKLNSEEKDSYSLSQNYPNPFSQQSHINYFIPETAKEANLKVYTLTGNLMKNTAIHDTGSGNLMLSSENLAPGLYIYTLEVDGLEKSSKKMIVQE